MGKGRAEEVWKEIEEVVKGRLVSVDELEGGKTDWSRVDKVSWALLLELQSQLTCQIYKLSEMNALKLPPAELLALKKAAIITAVAIKSVT